MPLKHKNSDEANKHTPKGFDNASNFSRLLRDEIGTSRYTRETTLPPAINFVDGANVPPTTVLNDVYVLIDNGGGAVNANWGGASYNDWVRFNGTNWGSVTPTAGDICYDQTAGIYKVFSTSWGQFIPDAENMSNADLTFGANHYADLGAFSWTLGGTAPIGTEKISLQRDTLVKGSDTSSSTSGFKFVDSVNASLLDIKNNGKFILDTSKSYEAQPFLIQTYPFGGTGTKPYLKINGYGEVEILSRLSNIFTVKNTLGSNMFQVQSGNIVINSQINAKSSYVHFEMNTGGILLYNQTKTTLHHKIMVDESGLRNVYFGMQGWNGGGFVVGGSAKIGTENISLQGTVLMTTNVRMSGLPTSSVGLSAGDLWNDAGTLKIV